MDAKELTKKVIKLEEQVFLLENKNKELVDVVNKLLLLVGDLDNKNLTGMMIEHIR